MRTVQFENNTLRLIDQTRLPHELRYVECGTAAEVGEAIRRMTVRGAPAIGVSAAYGLALAAREYAGDDPAGLLRHLERAGAMLTATRPTAVNLAWAVDRMLAAARTMVEAETAPPSPPRVGGKGGPLGVREDRAALTEKVRASLVELANWMADEDVAVNRAMGTHGAALVPSEARVLTHCNAGALACVDYGTALGVIRAAVEAGKRPRVFVDETRPFLQGARLTAWELQQAGVPVTLIADSMAGHFISRGEVDLVVVGADRIAANGDLANKIGTYTLAVLCKENGVPFYVAAPTSTIDLAVPTGAEIPIEERGPDEVTHLAGQPIAPSGIGVANPAFDVTPARYVTAIVTEHGICRAPYEECLRAMVAKSGTAGLWPVPGLPAEMPGTGQRPAVPGRSA